MSALNCGAIIQIPKICGGLLLWEAPVLKAVQTAFSQHTTGGPGGFFPMKPKSQLPSIENGAWGCFFFPLRLASSWAWFPGWPAGWLAHWLVDWLLVGCWLRGIGKWTDQSPANGAPTKRSRFRRNELDRRGVRRNPSPAPWRRVHHQCNGTWRRSSHGCACL